LISVILIAALTRCGFESKYLLTPAELSIMEAAKIKFEKANEKVEIINLMFIFYTEYKLKNKCPYIYRERKPDRI